MPIRKFGMRRRPFSKYHAVTAETLEERRFLSAGLIDTGFGSGGTAELNFSGEDDQISATVRQPNGDIVAAGLGTSLSPGAVSRTLTVLRYTSNGVLDSTFASGGVFRLPQLNGYAAAIGLQSDGKIVIVGSAHDPNAGASTDDDFLLLRLTANGSLDSTFGSGGVVLTKDPFAALTDAIEALQIEPSGQILIAGSASGNAGAIDVLGRFNTDGSIDTTFGNSGYYENTDGIGDGLNGLALLPGGQELALGEANYNPGTFSACLSLSRYNSDGTLDTTFADSGYTHDLSIANDDLSAVQFAVDASNNAVYVVAGLGQTYLIKYSLDGTLQTDFGVNGKVPLATNSYSGAVAVQSNGDIITAVTSGIQTGNPIWVVARYLPTGAPDSTFGQQGNSTFATGTGSDVAAVVIQPDGTSLIAGTDGTNFKILELLGDPQTGGISGTVFSDTNDNGVQDLAEAGISNAAVYIDLNENGVEDSNEPTTTTNSSGVYSFANVSTGSYEVREVLPTGYSLNSPKLGYASVDVLAGQVTTSASFADVVVASPLPGTVIGTSGSYKNLGNTAAKAFDGNLATYFDGPSANGNWVGLDLGSAKVITSLAYASRSGWAGRMNGGIFQASNSSTFASGVVNLYTIASNANPSSTAFTTQSISSTNSFRYVRYLSPNGSYGDVAELQFYGKPAIVVTPTTGSVSGTVTGPSSATVYLDANNNGVLDSGELSIAATGSFSFNNVPVGSYVIRQVVPGGYTQTTPAGGYSISVTAGSSISGENFVDTANTTNPTGPAKLTGTAIGTAGSYQNAGNTIAKALDGSLTTFFDGPTANGNWVGLDLGSTFVITAVSYASRSGWASRMNGGIFQGSNSPTFASGVVNLYTIGANANPPSFFNTQEISNTNAYRYVRYLSPNGSYGDVSEVQFFGTAPTTTPTLTNFTGTTIGTSGSYQNDGNTIAKAVDGSLSTFFDGATANGNWVGLDLGTPQIVQQISFAPRSGYASRMVSGIFQASNTADFSTGVVNLYTVTTAPASNVLTSVTINITTAYRYYRYLSPSNSEGDIAEVAFYG